MKNDMGCIKAWMALKKLAKQYEIEIFIHDDSFMIKKKISMAKGLYLCECANVSELLFFMRGYDLSISVKKEEEKIQPLFL